MTTFKQISYGIFYLFAFLISLYAILFLTFDVVNDSPLKDKLQLSAIAMYSHIIGGSIALFIGAFQLNKGFRIKRPAIHKLFGKIYVLSVLASGTAGLYMATKAMGGEVASFGFGALSIVWLITVIMAYVRVKQGNIKAHRQWMILNYALTCAAITLRLYLPLFPWLLGVDFITGYVMISWACWVPNLLIAAAYLKYASNAPQKASLSQ